MSSLYRMREAVIVFLLLVSKFQFTGRPGGMAALREGGREEASPVSDV